MKGRFFLEIPEKPLTSDEMIKRMFQLTQKRDCELAELLRKDVKECACRDTEFKSFSK